MLACSAGVEGADEDSAPVSTTARGLLPLLWSTGAPGELGGVKCESRYLAIGVELLSSTGGVDGDPVGGICGGISRRRLALEAAAARGEVAAAAGAALGDAEVGLTLGDAADDLRGEVAASAMWTAQRLVPTGNELSDAPTIVAASVWRPAAATASALASAASLASIA